MLMARQRENLLRGCNYNPLGDKFPRDDRRFCSDEDVSETMDETQLRPNHDEDEMGHS